MIYTTPNTVENLAAFAGYTAASKYKYSFFDAVSVKHANSGDTAEFCGEKLPSFQIDGTSTSSLSLSD